MACFFDYAFDEAGGGSASNAHIITYIPPPISQLEKVIGQARHPTCRSRVKMGQFSSKKNSTCDAVGQLKRHHILNFGQRNGILAEDELRTSIRSFTEKYKNLNAWKGDDTTTPPVNLAGIRARKSGPHYLIFLNLPFTE